MPGWDTHGLPIELKVLQALPAEQRRSLDTLGLRKAAREYALATVESQKVQFKRCVWVGWCFDDTAAACHSQIAMNCTFCP